MQRTSSRQTGAIIIYDNGKVKDLYNTGKGEKENYS